MIVDIKQFLHYYINTGAEVEYETKMGVYKCVLDTFELDRLFALSKINSIRFTNLIRVDELTDEQKVKLWFAIHKTEDVISDVTKISIMNAFLGQDGWYSPQLFHELLKLRVDLFNLMKL